MIEFKTYTGGYSKSTNTLKKGDIVKVSMSGETPWAIVEHVKDTGLIARLDNNTESRGVGEVLSFSMPTKKDKTSPWYEDHYFFPELLNHCQ